MFVHLGGVALKWCSKRWSAVYLQCQHMSLGSAYGSLESIAALSMTLQMLLLKCDEETRKTPAAPLVR